MKKLLTMLLVGACALMLLAGCGKKDGEDLGSQISVKKYKGLEIEEVAVLEVTDADVEASIRTDLGLLKKNVELTEGEAILGDTVTIDYAGKVDGVAFQGGTASNQELTLGSNQFIPGFEDKVVGHKVGETFDIEVTFPTGYQEASLAGKDAVFTVTIHKISRLPELTEDLLAEIGTTAKTIEEYKKQTRENLEKSNKETAQISQRSTILTALLEQCEIKNYPEDTLIKKAKDFVFEESYGALTNSMGIDTYVEQNYGMSTEDKIKELVKEELAIKYIAEKEDIVITEADYEAEVAKLAEAYGETDVEQFKSSFEMVYGEGYIEYNLLKDRVCDFLIKNSKQTKAK